MSVERKDIRNKLREIQTEVDSATGAAKPAGMAIGTLLSAGAVSVAYAWGQRKARKQTTIVEIRRE